MGKGDKKTKRGKIILGSSGVRRPKNNKKASTPNIIVKEAAKVEKVEKKATKKTKKIADESKGE